MTEEISNAGTVVIYGAKRTAQELLPFCENFAARENITVTVSHLSENDPRFLDGYPIREVTDVVFHQDTVVLVAMTEHFFPEIAQMPQIKEAGCVFYLSLTEVIEAKRYAAMQNLKRLGIDIRLFDRLYTSDLLVKSDISSVGYPSVREKMWELAAEESARYAIKHMRHARSFTYRTDYHSWLRKLIRTCQTPHGINLEFGVASGASLWKFADRDVNTFYGFDSFEGLPEEWFSSENGGLGKSVFKQGELPQVPENTVLIKGWFENTLPSFAAEIFDQTLSKGRTDINFIHVDCDLYSSAKTIFDYLGPFIRSGSIIAFDEYMNYPGWQMDEFKAFQEYVKAHQVSYEYLAYVERNTQVCVRIL